MVFFLIHNIKLHFLKVDVSAVIGIVKNQHYHLRYQRKFQFQSINRLIQTVYCKPGFINVKINHFFFLTIKKNQPTWSFIELQSVCFPRVPRRVKIE